jgi:hypothetical protein
MRLSATAYSIYSQLPTKKIILEDWNNTNPFRLYFSIDRWDGGGTELAGEYMFLNGKGNESHEIGTGLFIHKRIILAVTALKFVSDRMSYIRLRGRWCNIIVLNVHAPTEDKIDYIKDRFYEELEQVFDKFPKYHIKILLGDFNANVGFKPNV